MPPLRLMTYNIRHGRGVDGKVDLGRVAAVIEAEAPDVVTLQEVDHSRFRSGVMDQGEKLAARLGMEARFAPCMSHEEDGHYGIATMTRLPIVDHAQVILPRGSAERARFSEPRSALLTKLDWDGHPLDVINTHLSLRPDERRAQAQALARLGRGHDVIMAGDLNCTPVSSAYRRLLERLRGVPVAAASWPSRFPFLRLDHVLYRGHLAASDGRVIKERLARRASDHLPVVATFAPEGRP
jgi:endonuclease/exonuclease/phosphatase family metal-dependent hydrolase